MLRPIVALVLGVALAGMPVSAGAASTAGDAHPGHARHARSVSAGVAVLVYHNFIADEDAARHGSLLDEMTMSRAQFRAQLELLRREGANALTGPEFAMHVAGTKVAPPHSVLIVIDDGYESVYRIAWPVLREFGVPAVVAPIVAATEDPASWNTAHPHSAPHLTWNEIHEMLEPVAGPTTGVTITRPLVSLASHTYDMHENLSRQESTLSGAARTAFHVRLLADLKRARDVITARTGGREHADVLVWPHGGSSAALLETARKAGHTATFTDLGDVVRAGSDPMRLTRVHAGSGTRSRGALERNMRNAGW